MRQFNLGEIPPEKKSLLDRAMEAIKSYTEGMIANRKPLIGNPMDQVPLYFGQVPAYSQYSKNTLPPYRGGQK